MCSSAAKPQIPFINVQVPLDTPIPERLSVGTSCPIAEIVAKIRPSWELEKCKIEVFTNGITNKIFCISHAGDGDADKLVFRVFGAGTEQLIDRQAEQVNFERLAQAGLAPPIHANFKNGLVCGFLPGQCVSIQSVRQTDVVDKICRTMAAIHKIPLGDQHHPGGMKPPVFSAKSTQWLHSMPSKFVSQQSQTQFDGYFAGIDLPGQFRRLQSALDRIHSPLVFSHNDLLIFNILLDNANGKVHFIDYEYAGPNYQLFDIGNHFCEYAGVENPDYERNGPTNSERKHFLARYFFHFLGKEPSGEELDNLLGQTMHFEAASHFFWTLWAIHQANLSQIPFDYMQYAVSRHRQFLRLSAQLDI